MTVSLLVICIKSKLEFQTSSKINQICQVASCYFQDMSNIFSRSKLLSSGFLNQCDLDLKLDFRSWSSLSFK